MQRWNKEEMNARAHRLFETTYKKKRFVKHNHEIHSLARNLNAWVEQGINSLINGTYSPRFLKRCYFKDDVCDSLHLSDRIMQHLILNQLKPTFPFVMNPNCYHLQGPHGVRLATQTIKALLLENKARYFIRADIKSYYRSISHQLLIKDLHRYYHDKQLLAMLEEIIKNPIETANGYQNPDHGIALRGPLSSFFSGVFLKSVDDAFLKMNVDYIRFQDDILILCKTKRSLKRATQRLMNQLKVKQLTLSTKKTKIGPIESGFHFLGIQYLGTQAPNYTTKPQAVNGSLSSSLPQLFTGYQGSCRDDEDKEQQQPEALTPVLHPRTLRKAREQVKTMVDYGFSLQKIRSYLRRWASWWSTSLSGWSVEALLLAFINACRNKTISDLAYSLFPHLKSTANYCLDVDFTTE
jgi:RNA-directed DNA polymerase